jgi:hypothetical protein
VAFAPPEAVDSPRFLRVAIVGCTHGELDMLYRAIAACDAQAADGRRVDLLICCGDFQACRNEGDLSCMSCPDKYLAMQDFYRYYSGAALAPVPTLFIGGNHEASNHAGELPQGGWAAQTGETHFLVECSAKGACDRALGLCSCFDGYTGASCQRSEWAWRARLAAPPRAPPARRTGPQRPPGRGSGPAPPAGALCALHPQPAPGGAP